MPHYLNPGEALEPGDRLQSRNRRYDLVMQRDGNLVLYGDNGAVWHTGTNGNRVRGAFMQRDGNFVIYHDDGRAIWHTGTFGHPSAGLTLQDDRNIVIYDTNNTVLWHTDTWVRPEPEPPDLEEYCCRLELTNGQIVKRTLYESNRRNAEITCGRLLMQHGGGSSVVRDGRCGDEEKRGILPKQSNTPGDQSLTNGDFSKNCSCGSSEAIKQFLVDEMRVQGPLIFWLSSGSKIEVGKVADVSFRDHRHSVIITNDSSHSFLFILSEIAAIQGGSIQFDAPRKIDDAPTKSHIVVR